MYNIKPRRLSIFILFFIVMLWNVLAGYYGSSLFLFLFVLILGIGLASFRFTLNIHNSHLVYQLKLFRKTVIKKEIHPEEINQMRFIRVGWAKKAAIIKLNKGFNIRLAVIEPETAYKHLNEFAEKYNVSIFKTKDYLILEKMD